VSKDRIVDSWSLGYGPPDARGVRILWLRGIDRYRGTRITAPIAWQAPPKPSRPYRYRWVTQDGDIFSLGRRGDGYLLTTEHPHVLPPHP
jgi:hypothetical protein